MSREKWILAICGAIFAAIAMSDLPGVFGEWTDLIQKVSAGVAGVLGTKASTRSARSPVEDKPLYQRRI